ncbi:MAG: CRISPR-associated endonuclease Cas2 [Clostridia bacterium]
MRMILFFDLPSISQSDLRAYRAFRKFLISEGFLMMQESVYCKLVLNNSVEDGVKNRIIKNKPQKGLVQLMIVTEKQYARMEYLVGEKNSIVLDTDERLVIL